MRVQEAIADLTSGLRWYQWLWISFPLVVLRPLSADALTYIGGFIGIPAVFINYRLIHLDGFDGPLVYVSTGVISIFALGLYVVLLATVGLL